MPLDVRDQELVRSAIFSAIVTVVGLALTITAIVLIACSDWSAAGGGEGAPLFIKLIAWFAIISFPGGLVLVCGAMGLWFDIEEMLNGESDNATT